MEDKNNSMAMVTVVSGNLTASQLAHDFALTFPWKWEWVAKDNGPEKFMMRFPSVARIGEVSHFSSVTLRGSGAQISVARWTPETMAAGKLHVVWVRVNGVRDTMKNFHALCEIGSSMGVVQEVDMDFLEKADEVRIKVGVKDPFKIPIKTEVTTPKMLLYDIFFNIESVVERGWTREEKQIITAVSTGPIESGRGGAEETHTRDPKRQKSLIDDSVSKPGSEKVHVGTAGLNVQHDGVPVTNDHILAVENTMIQQFQQNAETMQCRNKDDLVSTDQQRHIGGSQDEHVGDSSQDRVQLSGSEGIDVIGTQESDLNDFAKQVGVVVDDSQELESFDADFCQQHGGKSLSNPRRSARLKDSEEVNVINRAKERAKVKDLEKGKGTRAKNVMHGGK